MGWNIFQDGRIRNYFVNDQSVKSLIISNIIVILIALIENWELIIIMFIYVFQSVIIGVFNFIRIISLKDFSTESYRINGRRPPSTKKTKISTALFFAFHYNIFHFGYFMFVFPKTCEILSKDTIGIISVIIIIIIFFVNHLFSFISNREQDSKRKIKIGALMMFPYARVFPMHLAIFIAAGTMNIGEIGSKITLVSFLLLKTAADVVMHVIEHRCFK